MHALNAARLQRIILRKRLCVYRTKVPYVLLLSRIWVRARMPYSVGNTYVYNVGLWATAVGGAAAVTRHLGWRLAEQSTFEAWLAELSAELAEVDADSWVRSITPVFAGIAARFQIDALSLWQPRSTGEMRIYLEHGGIFGADRGQASRAWPWLRSLLTGNSTFRVFSSLDDLPAEADTERAALQAEGFAALLLVPLRLDGRSSGQLLAAWKTGGAWTPRVQARLTLVGGLLSNTLGRLQAERAARQEQARFMQLLRAAPDAIVVVRADGCIEFVNDRAEGMFGYESSELHGQPVELLVPSISKDAHRDYRKSYVANPRVRVMGPDKRLQAVHKSGALIPVEISLSPVDTEDGPMVTAIVRDITERRHAEEKVREQRNELARVSRIATVGELAGALAHELNQPLAAILSNAQAAQRFLRRDVPDTEQVRQIVADIIDDDKRAAAVIYQMRRFLKHEEPELKEVDLNRLIGDTLRALQSDLAINQVAVTTQLADGLPLVLGNLVQLQQVVLNLVLNAVDAMQAVDHMSRILVLSSAPYSETQIRIAVSDSGPGVDKAVLSKIFGPFFTTKKDGMGMGLPITRSIVEAHGGQLNVSNNEERGCTFSVLLPFIGGLEEGP